MQDIDHTISALTTKINMWLGRVGQFAGKQCDHASVRRALQLPDSGAAIVIRIRGAYWVGTEAQDYCLKLGENLDECIATLAALGIH